MNERSWISYIWDELPSELHPCELTLDGDTWSAQPLGLRRQDVQPAANDA